jgi:putative ABC transport system ATP-binding protein
MMMNSNAATPKSGFVIETQGLTKVYRMGSVEVHALQSVNMRLGAGEFIALMGPSGSGKSTLMHMLGCLDTPTSGTVVLEGQEVSALDDDARSIIRSQRVGFVFQSFNLLPRLTALENVILPLSYQRHANGTECKAEDALQRVGLSGRLAHTPGEMSGGEKQRVAIARALVTEPALILADEPTGNLDSSTGDEILHLLTSLHKEGRTILMVTHSDHAAAYAERVITMRDGQIVNEECGDGIH